jgi:hypothetical protein
MIEVFTTMSDKSSNGKLPVTDITPHLKNQEEARKKIAQVLENSVMNYGPAETPENSKHPIFDPIQINLLIKKILSFREIIKINGVLYTYYNKKLIELEDEIDLFSNLQELGKIVIFKGGDGFVTKKELFRALLRQGDQYTSVSKTMTWPKEETVFYDCEHVEPKKTGKFDELLSLFKPLDGHSKILLKALFVSPAWGGGDGDRPVFVIQSDPNFEGKKTAFGKSTIPQVLAYLYQCSPIRLSSKMDEDTAGKRLAKHRHSKIILFDNVKKENWSSEYVEAQITAKTLMGHLMYHGAIEMRNHFTTIVTVNDPSVSNDMATRTVPIYLAHPGTKNNRFKKDYEKFIDTYRTEIIADILSILDQPTEDIETNSRFPEFEAEVLNKIDPCPGLGNYIEEGQSLLDADKVNWWEDLLIETLAKYTVLEHQNNIEPYFTRVMDVTKCSWWISSDVLQKFYLTHSNLKLHLGSGLARRVKNELDKLGHWKVTACRSFGKGTRVRGFYLEPVSGEMSYHYAVRDTPDKNRIVQRVDITL